MSQNPMMHLEKGFSLFYVDRYNIFGRDCAENIVVGYLFSGVIVQYLPVFIFLSPSNMEQKGLFANVLGVNMLFCCLFVFISL